MFYRGYFFAVLGYSGRYLAGSLIFSYLQLFGSQLFHCKPKGTIFFSKIFKGLNIRLWATFLAVIFGRYPHHTKAFCCSRNNLKPYQGGSKGAFAAYPRFNKWAAVFHDHLDCLPAPLSSAIAEQPATPYPSGIRKSRLKKRKRGNENERNRQNEPNRRIP